LAVQEKIKRGRAPTEDEIKSVLDAEKDPAAKEKIARMFQGLSQVMGLVRQRNKFIVNSALAGEGDVVIVIGRTHLKGLAEELDASCEGTVKAAPVPAGKIKATAQ
jgi:pheromone shutdown protein TraB